MILRNGNPSLYTAYGPSDRPVAPPQAAPTWQQRVEDMVRQYPAAGIAAALFMGVTLGWLLKRK